MVYTAIFHHITRIWACYLFLNSALAQSRHNVTIPSTSPEIIYTPFVCNASITNPRSCWGAWQTLDLDNTVFASTHGPASESANIIPQMFFRFQASALYLRTSRFSNSTTNITVSTNTTTAFAVFNASVGHVAVLNLPPTTVTSVAITFVSSADTPPTRLDIGPLTLTVMNTQDNDTTSLILPPESHPSSPPLPTITFFPSPSTSPTPSQSPSPSSNHQLVALGVGIVLGLGLGLTGVVVLGYICWQRRRRRREGPLGDSDAAHDDEKFSPDQ